MLLRSDVLHLFARMLHHARRLLHTGQQQHVYAGQMRFRVNPSTDTIWAHLSHDLRQFIRRRVSDEHAADDLLQETFIRIHRNLETLQDADRLLAWVYQIARNVVRDYQRKAADSTIPLGDADPIDDCDSQPSSSACQTAGWLGDMIAALPEGYREAVHLAEIEGLTQQQVAERFDITLSGAKSRVQRGRAMLREALDQCCTLQFDHSGKLLGCDPRPGQSQCRECGDD
jgi:RNA polymerase sigma-70 factor (ECF subfamily)